MLGLIAATGCGGGGSASPLPQASARPLNIAVVGDSISHNTVLSTAPCIQAIGPPPDCQYDLTGATSYPVALASLLHANVSNFSVGGTQWDTMISDQVPQISPASDVVIYEGGTNDLAYFDTSVPGGPYSHSQIVVAAIRLRAPNARIITIGVRYYAGSSGPAVNEWDTIETAIPNTQFIDLRLAFPAGDSRWPDGTHPDKDAVQEIAQKVAAAIQN